MIIICSNYRLDGSYGGALIISAFQFRAVNGFTNRFFGWGGEDDEFYRRMRARGFLVARTHMDIGRYKILPHVKDKARPRSVEDFGNENDRMKWDGLKNLRYRVLKMEKYELYTRIRVTFDESEIMSLDGGEGVRQRLRNVPAFV